MTDVERPLAGRRIVVTRAAAQAGPLSQHLRHLGATVTEVPAVTIQTTASADELRAAARRLRQGRPPRWLAVTSANAAQRLEVLRLPEDLAGVRAAAVGSITAHTLRGIGINVELVASGTGAAELAELLLTAGAGGGTAWLPQAEAARPELSERLRQAGTRLEVTVCYRTVAAAGLGETLRAALAAGIDAVALMSPSTVEAVFAALGAEALREPVLVCGGETTAGALRRCGLEPSVVAATSDPEGISTALVRALRRPLPPSD